MMSSNFALELQARQFQLQLLSQMSQMPLPSFANLQRNQSTLEQVSLPQSTVEQVTLPQWSTLDLTSLVGPAHQKTTFNLNGQENPSTFLPAFAPRDTLNLPNLNGSSFSQQSSTSVSSISSMLADFIAASQVSNQNASAPWLSASNRHDSKGLADTLKTVNTGLQQQAFVSAPASAFNHVLNNACQSGQLAQTGSQSAQSAQSTDENNDTEVEDADTGHDDDVDVEGSDADVTIFPRRKQGQDKLGRNRPAIKITRPVLEQLFNIPQKQACKRLGICATVMKRVCRKLGVHKWPYKESIARKQGHIQNRIMSQSC